MSEEQKKLLETQLWNIANELRGKMDADEFRDYILGFILFKYLSEKQYIYANELLETEAIKDYLKVMYVYEHLMFKFTSDVYVQELNRTTYSLARMNMVFHKTLD